MALTVAQTTPQSADVWGRQRVRVVTVTFDASYPTGGESFTPANVGLSAFSVVIPSINAGVAAHAGRVVQFDYTNNKLMVFVEEAVAAGGPLLEVADTTDLSTLVLRVLCIGS
jgi:hypothetical protein